MLNRNLSSITLSRHWLPCSVSLLTIALVSACGGGSGVSTSDPAPTPGTFNLLAARQAWLVKPLNEPVTVSGSFFRFQRGELLQLRMDSVAVNHLQIIMEKVLMLMAIFKFSLTCIMTMTGNVAILAIQQSPDFNVLFIGPTRSLT